MSTTDVPANGTPGRPKSPRLGWIIGGIALSLAMIGVGVGIGAAIWSGSSSNTVSAASNEAPSNPADTNGIAISLRSTWAAFPAGTHVTIDVNTPDRCVSDKRNQSFDPPQGVYMRTDVLFIKTQALTCDHDNNSWMTVTATNSKGTKTRRVNLYNSSPKVDPWRVNCDGDQPGVTLSCRPSGVGTSTSAGVTFTGV